MNRRDTLKSLLAGLFCGWLPKPKVTDYVIPDRKLVEEVEKMYIGTKEFYVEYRVWCVVTLPEPQFMIHPHSPALGIKNHW